MKKISSFTVIELIIALFISSVTIVICYYVFFLINIRYNTFYSNSQQIAEYELFYKMIRRDTYYAAGIKSLKSNELSFQYDKEHETYYFFYDSSIIRQQQLNTDTFHILNGVKLFLPVNDSIQLISTIKIEAFINKESLAITMKKEYTPKELMNYYSKAYD